MLMTGRCHSNYAQYERYRRFGHLVHEQWCQKSQVTSGANDRVPSDANGRITRDEWSSDQRCEWSNHQRRMIE
ncbi:hypothetical protein CDAR_538551 [Caerostris darwini]|uniref:Uncharacterized protein n=1 Tax=Caerostris darwini TaxID=1538125 RepID=A0AAV4UCT2_9ARAC|nr:hypothetical protein CDAR_538551 [Caerostris darwini]